MNPTALLNEHLEDRLPGSGARESVRRLVRGMVETVHVALQFPVKHRWLERLSTAVAAPHRLGAWDLARSDFARQHVAARATKVTIHGRRGALRG